MMNSNNSNILWNSAFNLFKSHTELFCIKDELEHQLSSDEFPFTYDAESYEGEDRTGSEVSDQSFVVTSHYFKAMLKSAGRGQKNLGYLTYGISLWRSEDMEGGENDSWVGARESKIYVGYDPKINDGWDAETMYVDGRGAAYEPEDAAEKVKVSSDGSGYLWEYTWDRQQISKPWTERSWFYALPVGAINDPGDITRKLIEPVKRLLKDNTSPADVFKGIDAYQFPQTNDQT